MSPETPQTLYVQPRICKRCGASIVWMRTTAHNWIPVDTESVDLEQQFVFVQDDRGAAQVLFNPAQGHRPHFNACQARQAAGASTEVINPVPDEFSRLRQEHARLLVENKVLLDRVASLEEELKAARAGGYFNRVLDLKE